MSKMSKRRGIRVLLTAAMVVILVTSNMAFASDAADGNTDTGAIPAPRMIKAKRYTNTSIEIKWSRVKEAKGYILYRYDPKKKKYKVIKTTGKKTTRYVDHVGAHTLSRYKVRSYTYADGKKVKSPFSYYVVTRSYQKSDKKVNAGDIKLSRRSVTMNVMADFKVTGKVKPSRFSLNKKKYVPVKKLRWISSDTGIVKVNSKGKIVSLAREGKCYIYAVAHNGVRKKVLVKVRDLAKEPMETERLDEKYASIIKDFNNEFVNIASFYQYNKPDKTSFLELDDNGELVVDGNISYKQIENDVLKLLEDAPEDIVIRVEKNRIVFRILEYTGEDAEGNTEYLASELIYVFGGVKTSDRTASRDTVDLSSRWVFCVETPGI